MKQYELWWAQLPLPSGTRPVLLLSRNEAYDYLESVVVVEISTRAYGIAQEVPVGVREGLQRRSVARFDNLMTIPKHWLAERIGELAANREFEIKHALGYAFDWPELVRI